MESAAQYSKPIAKFLVDNPKEVLGTIVYGQMLQNTNLETRDSWITEIADLQTSLERFKNSDGYIFFEYTIPRVGGRIDCGIIIDGIVFIIEFKTGESQTATGEYSNQLKDYARKLKLFHFESYEAPIIPILAIESIDCRQFRLTEVPDIKGLYENITVPSRQIGEVISATILKIGKRSKLDPKNWINSPYCPTTDIVDAARKLFDNHTVEQIKRSDAKGESLERTTARIMELIHQARENHEKILCMVTGVPGAGKTLIGLSVATRHKAEEHSNRSVYLSGNKPLVTVLQEALARDAYAKKRAKFDETLTSIVDKEEKKAYKKANRVTKGKTKDEIVQFIQEIYLWRNHYLHGIKVDHTSEGPEIVADSGTYTGYGERFVPYDHVAIFDEAQRTWNKQEHSNFIRTKSRPRIPDFPDWSEARFLISCMDRHEDWSVIICLIGNGQDINHGEAGVIDWIESVSHYPEWKLYAPDQIQEFDKIAIPNTVVKDSGLHLEVNLRSPRAENLSRFVNALLLPDAKEATKALLAMEKYPIVMTRDFDKAKGWLKENSQPYERYGIMASSKAQRLKPLAIDVSHSQEMNVAAWFLNKPEDVHSSYHLEDIATEFQVQGLELDWVCLAWDGDLLYDTSSNTWKHRQFRNSIKNIQTTGGWQYIRKEYLQNYHINAYRVLLTRARRGMVILIPEGDRDDLTRQKHFYDQTYNFFKEIGIPEI